MRSKIIGVSVSLVLVAVIAPLVAAQSPDPRTVIITQLVVRLRTTNIANADTNATVLLGVGGREFNLDIPDQTQELRRNTVIIYQIGRDSNVINPEDNSPEAAAITLFDVNSNSTYIRMRDTGSNAWNVQQADLVVVSSGSVASSPQGIFEARFCYLALGGLWLGPGYGFRLPLKEKDNPGVPCPGD